MERITKSDAETIAMARELAASLRDGDVLLLSGDLGAGKTTFVRGLAAGLGASPDAVTSPTFTLIQEYRGGRLPIHHVDLYRLEPGAAEELGLEELRGILAIEWPERMAHPMRGAMAVHFDWIDEDTRRIRVEGGAQ